MTRARSKRPASMVEATLGRTATVWRRRASRSTSRTSRRPRLHPWHPQVKSSERVNDPVTQFVLLLIPAALLKSPRSRRQRTVSHSQAANKTSTESILRSHTRTIYTAGRPPWYNCAGQQVEPFVIGVQIFPFQIILFLLNYIEF